jgi:predicted DNA repair protein MutK
LTAGTAWATKRFETMPSAGLLAVLDDIATVLDDVAVLTKAATQKTAGVLGDDLALNAQQVAGVRAERELPVVWAVAKGSLTNKAILVPAALAISALAPWAVTPLLMLGGAYLCFEGVEKLAHKFLHSAAEERSEHAKLITAVADPEVDLVAIEKEKIKGAVRTDFILSAEVVAIALGTVAGAPFGTRVAVLIGFSLLMTVGVYGLVAGIVKLDDLGQYLTDKGSAAGNAGSARRAIGTGILRVAPWLMKLLSVAGTVAMFLVGGGILTHGIPGLHVWVHHQAARFESVPGAVTVFTTLGDLLVGVVAGALVLVAVNALKRALVRPSTAA